MKKTLISLAVCGTLGSVSGTEIIVSPFGYLTGMYQSAPTDKFAFHVRSGADFNINNSGFSFGNKSNTSNTGFSFGSGFGTSSGTGAGGFGSSTFNTGNPSNRGVLQNPSNDKMLLKLMDQNVGSLDPAICKELTEIAFVLEKRLIVET